MFLLRKKDYMEKQDTIEEMIKPSRMTKKSKKKKGTDRPDGLRIRNPYKRESNSWNPHMDFENDSEV